MTSLKVNNFVNASSNPKTNLPSAINSNNLSTLDYTPPSTTYNYSAGSQFNQQQQNSYGRKGASVGYSNQGSINANQFNSTTSNDESQQVGFAQDQLNNFKEMQKLSEIKAFTMIVQSIPPRDVSELEKEIIKEELNTQNSMIMMIFRFFLQSNEYQFFIRRLKNVAMTKISLKQLKSNEGGVHERQMSSGNGLSQRFGVTTEQQEKNNGQIPSYRNQSVKQDYNRPSAPNSTLQTNLLTVPKAQVNMFQTPQKNQGRKGQFLNNLESTEQDKRGGMTQGYTGTTNLGSTNNKINPSSNFNQSIVSNGQSVTNFTNIKTQRDTDKSRQSNKVTFDNRQNNGSVKDSYVPKCNVLNQKDNFYLRKNKCYKGQSPKKYQCLKTVTFAQALQSIQSIGIDVSYMKPHMTEENDSQASRIGPNVQFKEIYGATGGVTPPIQVQSDSDGGNQGELTPTKTSQDIKNPIKSYQLSPQMKLRASEILQKGTNENPSSQDKSNIFTNVDSNYVINILRHQASKNHNKIEEDDVTLCLQIVSRSSYSNQQIQTEVKELFDEMISCDKINQRHFAQRENRYVLFQEIIGPITIKTQVSKDASALTNIYNSELVIKKCFETFKQQTGSRLIYIDEIKGFLGSSIQYFLYRNKDFLRSEIIDIFEKINSDHLINKTIHYESSKAQYEIGEWLNQYFSTPKSTANFERQTGTQEQFNDILTSKAINYSRSSSIKNEQPSSKLDSLERSNYNQILGATNHVNTLSFGDLNNAPVQNSMLKNYNQVSIQNPIQNQNNNVSLSATKNYSYNNISGSTTPFNPEMGRVPPKELQTSQNYEMYSQHNSSQFSTSLTNNGQQQQNVNGNVYKQRPSSQIGMSDSALDYQQLNYGYNNNQKNPVQANSRFQNNLFSDQISRPYGNSISPPQQNSSSNQNLFASSLSPFNNGSPSRQTASQTLQQLQNDNILHEKAHKAQRTYTLGFSGGLIENLNHQQNMLYQGMLDRQRQIQELQKSSGLQQLAAQQSQNRISNNGQQLNSGSGTIQVGAGEQTVRDEYHKFKQSNNQIQTQISHYSGAGMMGGSQSKQSLLQNLSMNNQTEREINSLNVSQINEVIKLKPTVMSQNTSQSDLSEKFSHMNIHERLPVNVFNVRRY